ncbi:uncharacterized protein LOC131056386 [Cryptomeria japonica]|uniref:uncharacterized protein LOC131056386 n=1 Tax=Cryptomeria japonica TaxID=3369 RepID=UPI0027DA398A|nr:uncharacterized protein LOC131056386 [Cryptomeria japonica]
MHSKRDNLRLKLTKDLRYPRPAWITDQVTWDKLMKDAKFKRKAHNNPNYRPSTRGGSKRRLRDTIKATQARVSSIGSHKLGFGGYNSIRGGLVHQFQKEASEEDLKYALLHGSQGLRQHLVDRGEILVSGHESKILGPIYGAEASDIYGKGFNYCLHPFWYNFCQCFDYGHGIKQLRFGWADGPGYIIIYAATLFWLPILPHFVFDFLRDKKTRSQWDTLSTGNLVQEVVHIENGLHPRNCISLLRLNIAHHVLLAKCWTH